MKIERTQMGLCFHGDVDKVKPNLTDEIFTKISELLGVKISGVKLSGYWLIYRGEAGNKEIISGDTRQGQPRRRNLSHALGDGLNIGIATLV